MRAYARVSAVPGYVAGGGLERVPLHQRAEGRRGHVSAIPSRCAEGAQAKDFTGARIIRGQTENAVLSKTSSPGAWGDLRSANAGQMAVEMAVLLPIIIVVALISYNVLRFVAACARFDRVALDCVISQGVSPSGSQASAAASGAVEAAIREAMGNSGDFDVKVSEASGKLPHLTRFTCELSMAPWPSRLVIAGIHLGAPQFLRHERSLTVDRYRPGVILQGSSP